MKQRPVLLLFALALLSSLSSFAQAPVVRRCPSFAEGSPGALAAPEASAPFRGWQCLEIELTSSSDPTSGGVKPYRDLNVTISLRKTGSTAVPIVGTGFWDGGRSFKFHTALPTPEGTLESQGWSWSTACTQGLGGPACASGLGLARSGSLTIAKYQRNSGASDLYKKGFLKVFSPGQQVTSQAYLTYGDGTTPFFWLGDTAWEGPVKEAGTSAAASWTTFLDNRKTKGFTVVLVAPAPTYIGDANRGFTQSGTCSDPAPNACSTPDFAYWRRFEQLVEEASRRGLVVAVLGMIDPVDRGGLGKAQPIQGRPYPRTGEAVRFAGYLAARLSGNHVVFSPGYDDLPSDLASDGSSVESVMKQVGAEIRRVAPRHLIGNHLAGSAQDGAYMAFESEAWFSFHLFHSGHAFSVNNACPNAGLNRQQCAVKRARALPLGFLARKVASANGEGGYEFPNDPSSLPPDNRYGARHTAYSSLCSGAFGPTCGVEGIYNWTRPTRTTFNSGGAEDFKRLGDRIRVRPWQNLKQMHNLILNNGGLPEQQKMVLAGTPDNKFLLAYLPNNPEIVIDTRMLSGLRCDRACPWSIRWFSAGDNTELDGRSTSENGPACGDGTNKVTLKRPNCNLNDAGIQGGCDWVVELRNTGCALSANAAATPPNNALTVMARPGDEATPHAIVASLTDLAGNPVGEEIPVSLQTTSFQKSPVSARDSAGNFWVVWQAQDLDGDGEGIFARRYDGKGNPLEEAFPVSGAFEDDQTDPSITADAAGRVVIAWTSHGQDGDLGGIYARRFDLKGQPLEAEFQVNTSILGHQAFPQVMADTVGNFVVAWEGEDADGDGRGVYSRLFDASGVPKRLETRVNTTTAGDQALAALQVAPAGEITIDWIGYDAEGEATGVFRQLYQRDGIPVGGETLMAVPPPDES